MNKLVNCKMYELILNWQNGESLSHVCENTCMLLKGRSGNDKLSAANLWSAAPLSSVRLISCPVRASQQSVVHLT